MHLESQSEGGAIIAPIVMTFPQSGRVIKTTESYETRGRPLGTSRRALTTAIAVLETGVNSLASFNAELDRHAGDREVFRCERALCRVVPNAISVR